MTAMAEEDCCRSAASAYKADKPSVQSSVPGVNAPASYILRLWNALTRWLLRTSSAFATFLQSVKSHSLPGEGSTAPTLWPMPLPYPEVFDESSEAALDVSFPVRALWKVLNLVVAALSWLHMGRPERAPACMALHLPLNFQQRGVVRRLERLISEVHQTKTVKPSDMGRNAAKVEGLDSLLCELHGVAATLPRGPYESALRKADESERCLAAGHELSHPGEVLGTFSFPNPVMAKPVDAQRLSFPEEHPEFNPVKLFSEPHVTTYNDPVSFAAEPNPEVPPPRVRVQSSREGAIELFHFLDRHRQLRLAPASQVRKDRTCGAFALIKDAEKDRLIIDARAPNELEPTLRDYCQTLGAVSALLQIELQPENILLLNGTDLRDYYYCFKISKARAYRNAFRFPLTRAQAMAYDCFHAVDNGEEMWYPCLSTMAMGDNNAVELGQGSHVLLGLKAGIFDVAELLTIHSRAPRGSIACGIIIDDLLIAEQLRADALAPGLVSEGERRLRRMIEEYAREGLTAHPKKTFQQELQAEFWGASVDGRAGTVRASPKRLIPLMELTIRVIRGGVATVKLLEILAGSWISILQCRKRMACLIDELYAAQQGRTPETVVRLSRSLVDELWLLVILGPLAVTDLRAQTLPRIYLSDASEGFKASVMVDISLELARELHRHALARGTWTKLLTPWKLWCKQHGELYDSEELPEGIPLVSHPVWLALAQSLQYKLFHRKEVRSKRHINLLELEAIMEVEERLATRTADKRYLLGADSQVALAAILKGRSSSPRLNKILQKSLACLLGSGLYGSYGYIPSLANSGGDPTRHCAVRRPTKEIPDWLVDALVGSFEKMDEWLQDLGYDPTKVAGLDFLLKEDEAKREPLEAHLDELRKVQKPERLQKFLAQQRPVASDLATKSEKVSSDGCTVLERSPSPCTIAHTRVDSCTDAVAPFSEISCTGQGFSVEESTKKRSRGQEEPCRGPQKDENKRQQDPRRTPLTCSGEKPKVVERVAKERVVPPEKEVGVGTSSSELPDARGRRHAAMAENDRAPELDSQAFSLLQQLPPHMFLLPGGRRATCSADVAQLHRRGVLDLYSGQAGVAKEISKKFNVWVVTVDFAHGSEQDLLNPELQTQLLKMMEAGAFLGLGAAIECCSFSRAVTPAVRSSRYPLGLDHLTENMQKKVAAGNAHASFLFKIVSVAIALDLAYWIENPDGSFLWLLPDWLDAKVGACDTSFRFDQCRYRTPWRKRTRIATNTGLRGRRELCVGGHSHLPLRGRSSAHGACWTKVAQTYPRQLCRDLAWAMGAKMNLTTKQPKLSIASCAHCTNSRIGEASNPGPRVMRQRMQRDVRQLENARLINRTTQLLQDRVWQSFEDWVNARVSAHAAAQLFLCPQLAVDVLITYGKFLFAAGAPLYEFRHVLVLAQQKHSGLRFFMSPAWQLISQWEEVQPVQHRQPLPEILFRAMFVVSLLLGWKRWAATLLLAFEGIARIGEVLQATRADLVLPCDSCDNVLGVAFLRIRKPKTSRRGKGRIQHLKISNTAAVSFLEQVFGPLDYSLKLFPLSASVFRRRWERVLDVLLVPKLKRPTPASVRGGGAILAYKRGEPISDILWRMRLVALSTLESYLQELAADSFLVKLPELSRSRIRSSAVFFDLHLQSPGFANTVQARS